jgi:hypothetical protein
MSRHHMLPPIVYTPPPPKKIEKKKRRIGIGQMDDLEEAAEAKATGASRSTLAPGKPPPPNFPAIEGAERKPQNPSGRLSETTLTELLRVQESELEAGAHPLHSSARNASRVLLPIFYCADLFHKIMRSATVGRRRSRASKPSAAATSARP